MPPHESAPQSPDVSDLRLAPAASSVHDDAEGALPPQSAISLKPLMFETFVCTLALLSFVALIGPLARTVGLAPWQAGAAMTMGGIAWVACARYWGTASDRSGRRRILLRGLGGFVVAHAALCAFIAASVHWLPPAWLVFVGVVVLRGIGGGFYAAVPATAGAFVADHFAPAHRAGALATLGASSAAGMVAGPSVAGLLATYSLSLPLYLTSALPAIALVTLWRCLPRTERHAPPADAHPEPMAFSDPRMRRPLVVSVVAMSCVTVAQVAVGFFALDRLGLAGPDAARVAGIALAAVGVALIGAQVFVRQLAWPPERFVRLGALTAAAGFAIVVPADSAALLWIGYFVVAFGMGWLFPALSALAANSVGRHEQGSAAGAIGSAHGLGMIVGPIAGMLAYAIDPGVPFAMMAVLMAWVSLWPRHRAATH